MHSLGDEFLGNHNGGGDDVTHDSSRGRDEDPGEGWESAEDRLTELAGAEVDGGGGGGADQDGGDATVETEGTFGAEGVDSSIESVRVEIGSALGLELGLHGVNGEEANVGECTGDGASGGTDEGTFEGWEIFENRTTGGGARGVAERGGGEGGEADRVRFRVRIGKEESVEVGEEGGEVVAAAAAVDDDGGGEAKKTRSCFHFCGAVAIRLFQCACFLSL